MGADRHGHVLTDTTDEAVAHYERALDDLLFYRPSVTGAVADMLAASPDSPTGRAFGAYLALLGTEQRDAADARGPFLTYAAGAATRSGLTPRERGHLAAVTAWLDGDMAAASAVLEDVTRENPRDALALALGHQLDFLTGDAVRLRDRVAGTLTAWPDDDPHRGVVLGMHAFGLEECGHYDRSEPVGQEALARNPRDVWAVHAVVHTYEMQGRHETGSAFFDARTPDWSEGNYLTVHNWWHYALFALERGEVDRVLEVYDASIHNAASLGYVMELLDASALLWRLLLAGRGGAETAGRWERLADAWATRDDGAYYAFNDVHAVMAYLGSGRLAEAERLIAARESWLVEPGQRTANHVMTGEIGLPVCRALTAYARGAYGRTVDVLLPIRRRLHTFGGSHAQRDAIQKTLLEAALRSGRYDVARMLVSERLAARPDSPYNRAAQARLLAPTGER